MSRLFVEGKLDAALLDAVLGGRPTVIRGGSKNALRPKTEEARKEKAAIGFTCYIRDRDFDYEPPTDRAQPHLDAKSKDGSALGWYWCRHEIENYLLEPAIVARALACDQTSYCNGLLEIAPSLRDYQAARAAIGFVRRTLPPTYHLNTRPADLKELALPDLSFNATSAWACTEVTTFHDRACPQLHASVILGEIERRRGELTDDVLASVDEILLRFAGKDLLAALATTKWFAATTLPDAGLMSAKLRDWIVANPDETLVHLPEWQRFKQMLSVG